MDVALLMALILLNGVLAMSEIAVVSSRQARLVKLAEEGNAGARSALALNREPSIFLSTVQVGITMVGILSGAIGEATLAVPLAEWLGGIPPLADHALGIAMTCASSWLEASLQQAARRPRSGGGSGTTGRWVIYDEAWRLMAYPSLLRRMDAQWRLSRHYGIANCLVFHKLSDLDNVGDSGSAMRALASSLLANAETRVVYRQEPDQLGNTADALGLTGTEQKLIPGLGVGQGLWRIKDHSYICQHQLHPAELAAFDTTGRMTGIAS